MADPAATLEERWTGYPPDWQPADGEELLEYLADGILGESHACPNCWPCPSCGHQAVFDPRGAVLVVNCERGCNDWQIKRALKDKGARLGAAKVVSTPVLSTADPVFTVIEKALAAVVRVEAGAPKTFRRGGRLVTVRNGEIVDLAARTLRQRLASSVRWVDKDKKPADPPVSVATSLIDADADEANVRPPEVERVVTVPTLRPPSGRLVTTPGYDAETRSYYEPGEGLEGLEALADRRVTWEDVVAAKALVLDELIGDFPFVDDADRANALGLFVLPFVRDLIAGPTPLHWVNAPEPGTGKGKLVDSLLAAGLGVVASEPLPAGEEERRKKLTAIMRSGVAAVKLDNVKGKVQSPALELALTEARWKDRILGASTSLDVPIKVVWTLTANNATPGTDLARRVVLIRLDARTEQPYRRTGPTPGTGWRHILPAWALEHRRELANAALTMCQWWVQQGMPKAQAGRMGSYEAWEAIVGGVLESIGVTSFLGNLGDMDARDDDRHDIAELFVAWRAVYGDRIVTSREVVDGGHVRDHVLPHVREWTPKSVGAYLRGLRDRIAGGYRLVQKPHPSKVNGWAVEALGAPSAPSPTMSTLMSTPENGL